MLELFCRAIISYHVPFYQVTTPEKWDVVTRKGGDGSLGQTCGLLIIDEVHLLGKSSLTHL